MKESVIERPGGSPARALPGREPSGREPLEPPLEAGEDGEGDSEDEDDDPGSKRPA